MDKLYISDEEITGLLDNWITQHATQDEFIIWGEIYGDIRERFYDGCRIHTSGIKYEDYPELKEGDIVKTRNSVYKLGKKYEVDLVKQLNLN